VPLVGGKPVIIWLAAEAGLKWEHADPVAATASARRLDLEAHLVHVTILKVQVLTLLLLLLLRLLLV
jgi:hypothetical protein